MTNNLNQNKPFGLSDMNPLFLDQRLNIIPIHKNSKRPTENWKKFQTENYQRSKLASHKGNYAIVCGKVSDGLIIIDFDDPKLYDAFFSKKPTLTIRTPSGGYHMYYISKEVPQKEQKFEGWSIDIQGEGSYALIPPSIIDNVFYEIINEYPIAEVDDVLKDVRYMLPKPDPRGAEIASIIANLKDIVDISSVIEADVKREHTGKGYWQGFCPFHDDKTGGSPSFTVYSNNFYCYSCEASGDVINYVQRRENLDNAMDAVRFLQKEWNISDIQIGSKPIKRESLKKHIIDEEEDEEHLKSAGPIEFYVLNENFYIDETPLKGKYVSHIDGSYEVSDPALRPDLEILEKYGNVKIIKQETDRQKGVIHDFKTLRNTIDRVDKKAGDPVYYYVFLEGGGKLSFTSCEIISLVKWREKLASHDIIFGVRGKKAFDRFDNFVSKLFTDANIIWTDEESEDDMLASILMYEICNTYSAKEQKAFVDSPYSFFHEDGVNLVKSSTILEIISSKTPELSLRKTREILRPYMTSNTFRHRFNGPQISVWPFKDWSLDYEDNEDNEDKNENDDDEDK